MEVRILGKMPSDPANSRELEEMGVSSPGKGSESSKRVKLFSTLSFCLSSNDGDASWGGRGGRMRGNERQDTQSGLLPTTDRNVTKEKANERRPERAGWGAGTLKASGD